MRLTIIPSDSAVYKDGVMKAWESPALDLSGCGIPANCHALQWYDSYGEIEFDPSQPGQPKPPNEAITALPQWALNCAAVWDAWSPPPPPPTPHAPAIRPNTPEPANTDYQAHLKWLAEGNTPLPADVQTGQNAGNP